MVRGHKYHLKCCNENHAPTSVRGLGPTLMNKPWAGKSDQSLKLLKWLQYGVQATYVERKCIHFTSQSLQIWRLTPYKHDFRGISMLKRKKKEKNFE